MKLLPLSCPVLLGHKQMLKNILTSYQKQTGDTTTNKNLLAAVATG